MAYHKAIETKNGKRTVLRCGCCGSFLRAVPDWVDQELDAEYNDDGGIDRFVTPVEYRVCSVCKEENEGLLL